MVAVGVISFVIGGFVGTLIMALCVAARNEEDRRDIGRASCMERVYVHV